MKTTVYKAGGPERVWNMSAHVKIIDRAEMGKYLAAGWVNHPAELREPAAEPVSEPETPVDMGEVSDGYHTFNELYAHRVRLFSSLMRACPALSWWSFSHSDGEVWEGWILAGIDTPAGAVTYHLPESEIPFLPAGTELEFGKEWDGHTPEDVLERLLTLTLPGAGAGPKTGTGTGTGTETEPAAETAAAPAQKKRGRPAKVVTDEAGD